jgi:hypothetical protein
MNAIPIRTISNAMMLGILISALSGCGPRVIISTGTTIGLKATPGDGSTRPPQVTFGYKRAETALVPTAGSKATKVEDAFSTLAALYFETRWFGKTELRSFVGTGIAAQEVQGQAPAPGGPALKSVPQGQNLPSSPFWTPFSDTRTSAGH